MNWKMFFRRLAPVGAAFVSVLVTGSVVVPGLHAQVKLEQRRPAPPAGRVWIESAFGSITVRGWQKAEVLVQGELAAGVEDIEFDGDKEGVSIDIDNPEEWLHGTGDDHEFRSRLEIFVPVGSSLAIETVNAEIDVEGITGQVELETVGGAIRAAGALGEVEARTMTGAVRIDSARSTMRIESISGPVTLSGASREVEVETVSGAVDIRGRDLSNLRVETVAGNVTFRGSLAKSGGVAIETFSGDVSLILAENVKAEFELTTFAGKIDSALGPKSAARKRFQPYQQSRFSTGFDEFDVEVSSHEGDITLRVVADPFAPPGSP